MKRLLPWYDAHGRDLPWRQTRDPYAIWVSEAMCQQTQVATVIPYYLRWMERFPTACALAAAELDDVLSLWQGLGYYRRARFLWAGAASSLPTDYEGWRAMPGVGDYTAAAIASICYGEPKAVVDGNVERVFARFTGSFATGLALKRDAQAWANLVLDPERPGDSNQAIMELGATICRPRGALCESCPLASECVAFVEGWVDRFPVPKPRVAVETLEWERVVPFSLGKIGLRRVQSGSWWDGMYEFPGGNLGKSIGVVKFSVTRYRITMRGFLFEGEWEGVEWFSAEELERVSIPAPFRKLLKLAQSSQTITGR